MGERHPYDVARDTGRRANSRLRLNLPSTFVLVDGHWPCVLENLSRTGARVLLDHRVKPGAEGFLRCQELELFGGVVWASEGRCGVMFDRMLEEQVLIRLRWLGERQLQIDASRYREEVRAWVGGSRRHL